LIMAIYVGDTGVNIQLDTQQSLTYATSFSIHCTKPNGLVVIWTATQVGTTQIIQYVTGTGDLDLAGDYIIHSYVEFGSGSVHSGDPIELHVGTTDLTGLITTFRILYRYISSTDLPYEKFKILYELAVDEHAQNLVTYGNPVLTTSQTNAAFCHLVGDYFEKGNPDWSYSSQSISPGVSFSRSQKNGIIKTPARTAYEDLLDGIVSARTAAAKPFFHYTAPIFTKKMMEIEPEVEGTLEHITE
jgi:hypothetical protein